jgi:hypothetical protein
MVEAVKMIAVDITLVADIKKEKGIIDLVANKDVIRQNLL